MVPALNPIESKTMTDFQPFQGWRYNAEKVRFSGVIAPPYDVISPAKQGALYGRSEYNCIRLILNQETPADNDADNRYTRARDFFQAWCRHQILLQDLRPCFYLYRQIFNHPVTGKPMQRLALLGRLHLEPFENKVVIPHEKTLSKPRADRMRLLRTAQTNFSPVFGLYEDPAKNLGGLLAETAQREALFDVEDDEGVRHALWNLDEPAVVRQIQTVLKNKKIYIADGHHRYQTALDYGLEQRKTAGGEAGDWDYVLMALVEFQDPGLMLFPTHRLITGLDAAATAQGVERLRAFFEVAEVPAAQIEEHLKQKSAPAIVLGLILEGRGYLLTLKDWKAAKAHMPAGHADLWYQLDVNLVSHLILAHLWQIPEAQWEARIRYTHAFGEVQAMLDKQTAQAALILKAPRVEILRDMGAVNELMAQKSTYFYPKLASGLVFYRHEL